MKKITGEKKSVWFVLRSALSIVGAIVGIGFVSGREIVSFFFKYSGMGFVLASLSCLGLFLCIIFSSGKLKFCGMRQRKANLKNCKNDENIMKNHIKTSASDKNSAFYEKSSCANTGCVKYTCEYHENINDYENNHKFKNRKMQENCVKYQSKIHEKAINFERFRSMLVGCFQVVISGCMMAGVFDLVGMVGLRNVWLEVIIISLILVCMFLLLVLAEKHVIKVSGVMTFVLMAIMVLCLLFGFFGAGENDVIYIIDEGKTNIFAGLFSCIFYVSMNMLSCTGMIAEVKKKSRSFFQVILIALLSGGLLFLLLFLILSMYNLHPELTLESMPLLTLAGVSSGWLYYIYFCGLFLGGMLALMSVIYSALKSFEGVRAHIKKLDSKLSVLLIMVSSLLVSFAGFGFLVDWVYPLIGMVYLILSVFSLYYGRFRTSE